MKTAKVTRILHSQGLHQAKCERLTRIAALCGRVRADAWQRCSGLSTAQQSAYEIRNAWMAEGYDWHGLPAPMSSSRYRHRGTNRRLSGWVKGIMADTLTSISRRRGSALVLVNPAYTSQIDSRTGLLQGTRRGDRCYGLDGVVLDADTNAARNILQRLYDDGITLYTPYREVKRLLRDRSGTTDGTAHPGLEPARQLALP